MFYLRVMNNYESQQTTDQVFAMISKGVWCSNTPYLRAQFLKASAISHSLANLFKALSDLENKRATHRFSIHFIKWFLILCSCNISIFSSYKRLSDKSLKSYSPSEQRCNKRHIILTPFIAITFTIPNQKGNKTIFHLANSSHRW